MITDRDICIAAATRNRKTSDIKAEEMMRGEVFSCAADDDLETALKKMKKNQLKRLPITGERGELVGILSIADILLRGRKDKKLRRKIYLTLKAIGTSRPIVLKEISGSAEIQSANF
jgi:CBS-domain-containing membrane protein